MNNTEICNTSTSFVKQRKFFIVSQPLGFVSLKTGTEKVNSMTGPNPYPSYPQQPPQQGQPMPQQQPRQMEYSMQPSHPPHSTGQHGPEAEGGKGTLYFTLLLLGLIIFFVAGIIRSLLLFEDFMTDGQQNIYATTHLLMNIGLLISVIGLSMGGLMGKNLSEKIRCAMVGTVGVCIVVGFLLNVFILPW